MSKPGKPVRVTAFTHYRPGAPVIVELVLKDGVYGSVIMVDGIPIPNVSRVAVEVDPHNTQPKVTIDIIPNEVRVNGPAVFWTRVPGFTLAGPPPEPEPEPEPPA